MKKVYIFRYDSNEEDQLRLETAISIDQDKYPDRIDLEAKAFEKGMNTLLSELKKLNRTLGEFSRFRCFAQYDRRKKA